MSRARVAGRGATTRQLHDDIDQALRSPTPAGAGSRLHRAAKARGRAAWALMKRHPFLAVLGLGAASMAVAAEIGAAELGLGCAIAIAAYRVLREGEPPLEALQEVERAALE